MLNDNETLTISTYQREFNDMHAKRFCLLSIAEVLEREVAKELKKSRTASTLEKNL